LEKVPGGRIVCLSALLLLLVKPLLSPTTEKLSLSYKLIIWEHPFNYSPLRHNRATPLCVQKGKSFPPSLSNFHSAPDIRNQTMWMSGRVQGCKVQGNTIPGNNIIQNPYLRFGWQFRTMCKIS
jgi:hypothetical protein